jgi:hypothetical protein
VSYVPYLFYQCYVQIPMSYPVNSKPDGRQTRSQDYVIPLVLPVCVRSYGTLDGEDAKVKICEASRIDQRREHSCNTPSKSSP